MLPRAPRDSAAFEFREAMARPGCPICSLALRSVGRYLSSVAYEQVNDLDTRAALRARGGFCNLHAYRWLRETHNVLGTALIYRDVLRAGLADASGTARHARRLSLLDRLMGRREQTRPAGACPACSAQREAEGRYISALLAVAAEASGEQVLQASDGVCLVHAAAVLRRGGPGSARVLARTRQHVEQVIATLDEVIRKEDYRFREEPRTSGEREAPTRAVAAACGADGLQAGSAAR